MSELVIVLVEDEPDVANIVQMALTECDFVHCADGLAALEVLQGRVSFDLMILDMLLPGCPGIDVFFEARHCLPNLPVLIISGHATNRDIALILEHPRTKLLAKPFPLADLRVEVARLARTVPATRRPAQQHMGY